ncbi:hypothetical protein GE21DRAFT_1342843, partial [Neurospora crassa]
MTTDLDIALVPALVLFLRQTLMRTQPCLFLPNLSPRISNPRFFLGEGPPAQAQRGGWGGWVGGCGLVKGQAGVFQGSQSTKCRAVVDGSPPSMVHTGNH